jgi:competence protein ComEC
MAADGTAGPVGAEGMRQQADARRSGWLLVAAGLAWLLGLWLQLQQAQLWPLSAHLALVAAGALGLLAVAGRAALRRAWWLRPAVLALAVVALAFASTAWRADSRLAQRLDAALEGQDLLVTGVVASLPQAGPAGTRFLFTVESARLRGQPVVLPPRLALGWYTQFHDETWLDDPRPELRAGQRWRLPLRLKRPHGGLNPHGFDVELLWFEQGVGATGWRPTCWPMVWATRSTACARRCATPCSARWPTPAAPGCWPH